MKSVDELFKFYYNELMPDLQRIDAIRLKALSELWQSIAMWSVPFVLVMVYIFRLNIEFDNRLDLTRLPVLAYSAACFYFVDRARKTFHVDFKSSIIKRLVNYIDPKLEYQADELVEQEHFVASDIFRTKIDSYLGDDKVVGKLGSTDIEFSELDVAYTTSNGKSSSRNVVFKGLFFMADFNKDFSGRTYVLPDISEKNFGTAIGTMFQKMNKGRGELVKLEDLDFEKEFAVYGDDQIEARYILTHSLMKRIVDFKKKSDKELYFSFIGSKVYVAIPYPKELFEPKLFTTLLDFEPIKEYYNDLMLAVGIVEELNLNTRIWTKE